jgi:hypothetical protein
VRFYLVIFYLIFCACKFLHAQTVYYNKTHDTDSTINAYGDIFVLNQDTILIEGFNRDKLGKRFKTFSYINSATGDTVSTFKHGRDTLDIYGGSSNNLLVIDDIIYSCGAFYKNGLTYASFLKFSLSGDLILDTLYNPLETWSEFDCILPSDDGNFFLLGSKEVSFGNLDVWLVKMDPFGNILWEQTYGGVGVDMGFSISKNSDNTFILSMFFDRDGINKSQVWIKKIDLFGSTIWDKKIGGADYDGAGVTVLSDSSIILWGNLSTPANTNAEPFYMKLDQDGNELWRRFPQYFQNLQSSQNGFTTIIENADKTLSAVGSKRDEINFRTIGFLQKIAQDGDSIWHREVFIRNNNNYLSDLKLLDNGDFLMAGYVFPDAPTNTQDGWIMRTNCLGYFEHPKDSIVFSGVGGPLSVQNFSTYFEYSTISWGDGNSDTLYEGNQQLLHHTYALPGNYFIETRTIACNDTLKKTFNYTVNPSGFTNQHLTIFPNPSEGNFQLWLNSEEEFQLEVFDYKGRLVFETANIQLSQGYQLDLSLLQSAIYVLKVSSVENVFQERIVITK